ncbi:unnamed protein product [Somion occarium]|uniref:DUF6593 domain-containing protein n=1 Tax=Somion occarium TaxID=3059160 RepID=A0ABP1CGG1_9APHY
MVAESHLNVVVQQPYPTLPTKVYGAIARLPTACLRTSQYPLLHYTNSAQISGPVVLQFVRCSPFAMVVTEDLGGVSHPETGTKYHISVGVNIWMPNCTVTTIRRGPTEDGRLVAQLELGIMAGPATVTMAGQCRPLSSIMHRKSSSSSSRTYDLLDGRSLKWKLHSDAWRAYINSQEIASFDPTPPRKLILLPTAHRFTDHIIVCLVILMREHLTPKTGLVGDASQLFNYSPYFHTGDD